MKSFCAAVVVLVLFVAAVRISEPILLPKSTNFIDFWSKLGRTQFGRTTSIWVWSVHTMRRRKWSYPSRYWFITQLRNTNYSSWSVYGCLCPQKSRNGQWLFLTHCRDNLKYFKIFLLYRFLVEELFQLRSKVSVTRNTPTIKQLWLPSENWLLHAPTRWILRMTVNSAEPFMYAWTVGSITADLLSHKVLPLKWLYFNITMCVDISE